jgi:hypothetical protein
MIFDPWPDSIEKSDPKYKKYNKSPNKIGLA